MAKKKSRLTLWVLLGMVSGVLVGAFFPKFGMDLKCLSDVFIKLIRMVISPIIFLTVSIGIGTMKDVKKLGSIGLKALVYFEIITGFALALGIAVALLIKPGVGFDVHHVASVDISAYTSQAQESSHTLKDFLMNMIPDSAIGIFARNDMLPILIFSVLFGLALSMLGSAVGEVEIFFEKLIKIFFKIVSFIMLFSPVAVFGAMAYTVGKFGTSSIVPLIKIALSGYLTMILFVGLVLSVIAWLSGFSLWKLLKHIKDEIVLTLGTASSESAFPTLMEKLEKVGCKKSVVGVVLPTGYAFNLDGTSIYLSMSVLFIAQVYNIHLGWMQLATILGVLLLTSKGAAAVVGSGFVTLVATLCALPGHPIPVEGVALLLGIDRFMSEARSVTNLIGNSVATVVIAKMEKEYEPKGIIE